ARIGNEPGARDSRAAEFRQSVNRVIEQCGRGMFFLVPSRIRFRIAEAKSAAEVNHANTGVEHGGSKLHRDFGWRCEKNNRETRVSSGIGRTRNAFKLLMTDGLSPVLSVVFMFQQHRVDRRMSVQDADKFRSAIASKTGDSGVLLTH